MLLPDLLADHQALSEFKAEADIKAGGVPEKPDGYELRMPEDVKLPEGMNAEIDPKDPVATMWREIAHKARLSQETFDAGVKMYVESLAQQFEQAKEFHSKELAKLGDKAEERRNAVETALAARIGKEKADVVLRKATTAAEVEAFEALIRAQASPGAFNGDANPPRDVPDYSKASPTEMFMRAARTTNGRGEARR